ncbi:E3 ubiquitin-protein ligase RING1-like [Senna tora]|uniref:E3 ubiquitin-protein ligase RING1-like n=1 Tax=Senna tora TaxID=362788 RepID=A0A834TRK4_9FABA|nr:E3 ubiquitin-protein ligase RING1-like [Senna tora]
MSHSVWPNRVLEEREKEVLSLPKYEKKFRNALPNPRVSLDLLILVSQDILLGTPTLLNPPSISVYTTGSSRSAALLPPVNLPTANPPPGSLHIVNPTDTNYELKAMEGYNQNGKCAYKAFHGHPSQARMAPYKLHNSSKFPLSTPTPSFPPPPPPSAGPVRTITGLKGERSPAFLRPRRSLGLALCSELDSSSTYIAGEGNRWKGE